jgi:hypothetical protein
MTLASRGRRRALAALALLLAAAASPAAGTPPTAGEDSLALRRIMDAGPQRWRDLASTEFATRFDAWRARATLTGYESCWIDDVTGAFWCLYRAPGAAEAGRLAAAQAKLLDACWPGVPTDQAIEDAGGGVTRLIQDWHVAAERRVRLVQRRAVPADGLNAVFLYLY